MNITDLKCFNIPNLGQTQPLPKADFCKNKYSMFPMLTLWIYSLCEMSALKGDFVVFLGFQYKMYDSSKGLRAEFYLEVSKITSTS